MSPLVPRSLLEYAALINSQSTLLKEPAKLSDLLADATINKPQRYKVDEDTLIFLNDLEKDEIYSKWPKEKAAFLQPSPGGVYRVALNVVTAILCIDPTIDTKLVKEAQKWIKTGIPVRFAILLVNNKRSDRASRWNKYLYGQPDLGKFIEALEMVEVDEVDDAIVDAGAPAQYEAARMQQQLALEHGTILINGRPILVSDVNQVPREILTGYREEIELLQESLALNKPLKHQYHTHRNPAVNLDQPPVMNLATLPEAQRKWILSAKPYLTAGIEPKHTIWIAIDMEQTNANRIIDEFEKVFEAANALRLPSLQFRILFPASQLSPYTARQMIEVARVQAKKTGFTNIKLTWEKLRHATRPASYSPKPRDLTRLNRKQRANKESIEGEMALQEELLEQMMGRAWDKTNDLAIVWINGKRVAEIKKGQKLEYADWEQMLKSENGDFATNTAIGTILDITRERFFGLMTTVPAPNLHKVLANVDFGAKDAPLQIEAVMDPLSPNCKRLLCLVEELKDLVHLRLILNPTHSTTVAKNIYRWNGDQLPDLGVNVAVKVDAPPTWSLQRTGSGDYDAMQKDDDAIFELKSFAIESWLGGPMETRDPKGKPIEVGAWAEFEQTDGTVLKPYSLNMGYLQVLSTVGGQYKGEEECRLFPVSLGLNRHRMPKGITLNFVKKEPSNTINVFSIAAGLTYERMLRIMIASVMRNTADPVHFWLVDNFASRDFKESVEAMSVELGFAVSWLNYRWPSWLHPQTQLHRQVWAYKILFLDAMLPESVDRLIYIDADQVVRGDLAELRDHDLKGAPYGMVPFCNDGERPDTEGYRFWKGGFWEQHLRGATYHISALFVVDMPLFRRLGVGHRLRQHYHMLSQDPNSLANLDQDLPNYLQSEIPIHSLPQSWLWCETWCGESSKSKAKSIDLCSHPNPIKYESKIEEAKRIIKEWSDLDKQVIRILEGHVQEPHEEL